MVVLPKPIDVDGGGAGGILKLDGLGGARGTESDAGACCVGAGPDGFGGGIVISIPSGGGSCGGFGTWACRDFGGAGG